MGMLKFPSELPNICSPDPSVTFLEVSKLLLVGKTFPKEEDDQSFFSHKENQKKPGAQLAHNNTLASILVKYSNIKINFWRKLVFHLNLLPA